MERRTSDHPRWELVVEIATRIWVDGEYVIEMDLLPTQNYVDVQWAAREAGRVLGSRSQLSTTRTDRPGGSTVTITVTLVDVGEREPLRAEEAIEQLLRSVLQERADD